MKKTRLLIFLFIALMTSLASQSQTIVFEDNNHIIYHKLVGDSVLITVEDLKDFTLDLSNDSDPTTFEQITFMFDINQTGTIDAGTGTDVYYQTDNTLAKNVCKGDILDENLLGPCGGLTTKAVLSASIQRTITSNTAHMVYEISIPKSELYTSSQVCARMSVKINKYNSAFFSPAKTFPTSGKINFIDVYFPINLFEAVDLGDEVLFCVGDSVKASSSYPNYSWSNSTSLSFMTPSDSGLVHLTVKDNTCSMSDTVKVVIQDENHCSNLNLRFPNVVTPNSDGINDFFEPLSSSAQKGMDYTGTELSIYNRWGVKVGGKKGQAPYWDCHLDWGQKAPSGTYYFAYDPGSSGSVAITGFFIVVYTEK
jgi:gliding motility-associated-like protein